MIFAPLNQPALNQADASQAPASQATAVLAWSLPTTNLPLCGPAAWLCLWRKLSMSPDVIR
jgi:hypothetical protein